jgi:hypothetical protein
VDSAASVSDPLADGKNAYRSSRLRVCFEDLEVWRWVFIVLLFCADGEAEGIRWN